MHVQSQRTLTSNVRLEAGTATIRGSGGLDADTAALPRSAHVGEKIESRRLAERSVLHTRMCRTERSAHVCPRMDSRRVAEREVLQMLGAERKVLQTPDRHSKQNGTQNGWFCKHFPEKDVQNTAFCTCLPNNRKPKACSGRSGRRHG